MEGLPGLERVLAMDSNEAVGETPTLGLIRLLFALAAAEQPNNSLHFRCFHICTCWYTTAMRIHKSNSRLNELISEVHTVNLIT